MQRLVYYASLLLIFGIPAAQIPISEAVGSVNRILGFVVLFTWLMSVAWVGQHRRLHAFHVMAFAFLLWNIISLIWTVDGEAASDKIQRYIQSVGITLILWDVLRTRAKMEAGMQAFILGALASIGFTVYDYQAGLSQFSVYGRYAASGFNPNDLGVQLAIGVPVALYLFARKREGSRALRMLNGIYPFATAIAIVLTASRGALIAALPGFILGIWSIRGVRIAWRLFFAVLLVAAAGIFMQMEIQSSLERFSTIWTSAEGDRFTGRIDIWDAGVTVFFQHPIIGVGVGGFPLSVIRYINHPMVAHNLYLSILVEGGIIGFLLLAGILGVVLHSAIRAQSPERLVWLVALLSWAIGVFSLTWEYVPQTWLLFAFVVGGSSLEEQPEKEGEHAPVGESPLGRTRREKYRGNRDAAMGDVL